MRHRDDDLSPFREDPLVKALTAPGTEAELSGEATAVAAYREAVPVKAAGGRSAARLAAGTTATIVVLGLSGGVAAAYANYLPDSWQKKLHDNVTSTIPEPEKKAPKPPVALSTPPPVVPVQSAAPTPTPVRTTSESPRPDKTPTTVPSASVSPDGAASVPVVVPTTSAPASPSAAPSATPTPTPTRTPPPADGGRLQIRVSPGDTVTVGTRLTVIGRLMTQDGHAIANRRVVLIERVAGQDGRHRVGSGQTSADGVVTIAGPVAERNLRLVLRADRHVRSGVQRVVVTPVIHVEVPPTAPGARSVAVRVSVRGAQAGDVVTLRGPGTQSRQAKLDGSSSAVFTVPVASSQTLHYRVTVQATRAHAAHSLAFYVPPSGG